MAVVETSDPINHISGKLSGNSSGYFYMRNGKQFYRVREEGYQAKQSPRQKWNSAAFAYTHKQLRAIETDEKLTKQMQKEYEAALHKAPNGKAYTTAHAWKFNTLLYEWKQSNPFEKDEK